MADERRYQVFVSSTYEDLREARQKVTSTLLEADCFPAGMELFPATDDDAWSLIKRVIDESDYYLLIIGGRYGSVDAASGLSYTEMEYDYAVANHKPVMCFLHGEPGSLAASATEPTDEGKKKLDAFKKKITAAKHVKWWRSPDELAGQVALTLNKFVKTFPAEGWIKASGQASTEVLAQLAEAQRTIARLEDALKRTETDAPEGTAALAHGSDTFKCHIVYHLHGRGPARWENLRVSGEADVPWDYLFGAVCAEMFDESSEPQLKKSITSAIVAWQLEADLPDIRRIAIEEEWEDPDDAYESLTLNTQDFHTIVVQFHALGLTQLSEKKHPVTDKLTYWALTPYGRTRATQLRALTSGEHERRVESATADAEEELPTVKD